MLKGILCQHWIRLQTTQPPKPPCLLGQHMECSSSDGYAASKCKLLHALKLLRTMLQLADYLGDATVWSWMEQMLTERHTVHSSQPSQPIHRDDSTEFSYGSLLDAILRCYNGCLVSSVRIMQAQRRERADRLKSMQRAAYAPTKSYQAHRQIAGSSQEGGVARSSSDMTALLLAKVLASVLTPECLPGACQMVMLDYSLPMEILNTIKETSYFDHCEVSLSAHLA